MADILNISELGRLEIIEIYDYYDQPILFACKNAAGHLHLVVAADEDEQHETWLYIEVSLERLNLIRSGTIDLHDAFAYPENGYVFQIRFPYDNPTSPQIEFIEANQVPEDMLPTPGESLDLESEMPPVLGNTEPMSKNNQDLELILLDKCTIQSLKLEELEIVSKYKILVPDIVLIENLKREETISKLSKLENTYRIEHWQQLGKYNLLGQEIKISQADLTEITDDPVKLRKQVKLAKKIAAEYDEFPQKLLQQMNMDFSIKSNMDLTVSKFQELYPNIDISDSMVAAAKLEMKKRKSPFSITQDDWTEISQFIIDDLNNKPIRKENRHLKENDRVYIRNKEWLDFACAYFQTTKKERTHIFKRWEDKFHQNLEYFAPYAYYILALELTIVFRILKSKGSYKREIMRDLGYIYYANCKNVTFHTCDHQLKKTIQKIPFLKHIREKMVYFYNDEEQRPGELNRSDWLKMLKNTD